MNSIKSGELLPKEFEGIKLRLDWRWMSSLDFYKHTVLVHEDSCAIYEKDGWSEDNCSCKPQAFDKVSGQLKAFLPGNVATELDKRYWYCNISNTWDEFMVFAQHHDLQHKQFLEALWTLPELYPPFLLEDINNAMSTLYTYLKYYEATGKEWNMSIPDTDKIIYDRE